MNGNKKLILGCLIGIIGISAFLVIKSSAGNENDNSTQVVNDENDVEVTTGSSMGSEMEIVSESAVGASDSAEPTTQPNIEEDGDKKDTKQEDEEKEASQKDESDEEKEEENEESQKSSKNKKDEKTNNKAGNTKKASKKSKAEAAKKTEKNSVTTTAVPVPTPTPQKQEEAKKNECTLNITCEVVFNHMDKLSESAKKVIPANGIILNGNFEIQQGDTVFDILKRVCMEKGIHLDYVFTPMYSTYYIKGIHNLYEFDCGEESGWMYSINGVNPGEGSSHYEVKQGDIVVFYYTCER